MHDSLSLQAANTFQDQHLLTTNHLSTGVNQQNGVVSGLSSPGHKLAGLKCDAYGGPSEEIAQEMVYWQDIPGDAGYMSPFHPRGKENRYMTFEPDGGGWNNIRMAMETVLAMAHAMGRTLVLPPEQQMYLLTNKGKATQKKVFSFNDFFHMDSIANEHPGLEIITMKEFLDREAMAGKLKDKTTGKVSFPPGNRTRWDGDNKGQNHVLSPWLSKVAFEPVWNVGKCQAAFPASADPKDIQELRSIESSIKQWPKFERFVGKPTPVDGPAIDRMQENGAGRSKLCIYDEEMQREKLIHFSGRAKSDGGRLLVHFYAFLFFQDWRQDLWMKRFIRDHVRYIDELQCAAARIVNALRERARKRNPENIDGAFDSFHIRRGDFQYKNTRVSGDEIYEVSKDELTEGATVYIATDERDRSIFKPLSDKYDVVYLDDFLDLAKDLNTNYYGMLDQLVASKGRIFFGCWFSTFTGYINRIRGYHADALKLPGYEEGIHESYYYALAEHKTKMKEFYPVKQAFHAREFPASWRMIDKGIGELHNG
eukprot:CAMPEP_0195281424 /NCGR_PEP_ID=MMETSP0707-20130614/739_1 /TAXON_ID=33640 /ORGANISM="Asterionellopsis glacialis, Strain CCMP134" /LENGTH=537 /DNA_ID=CAMNT_0040340307 /DNA_START=134 /DNA_END=1747 /DNA_ORIENTATION=-